MKNEKKIFKVGLGLVIVLLICIVVFLYKSELKTVDSGLKNLTTYSAVDILGNVDFSVESQSVELKKIDAETEEMFSLVDLTNETKQELIKALENSEFKKTDSEILDYDYRFRINSNTAVVMYLDSNKNAIRVLGKNEQYLINGDNEFFNILEKVVTK